jgi:hypothetical protein
VPLFGALRVASGRTVARTRRGTTCAECKAFLLALVQRALCAGLQVVHLLLDNGSPHAPKPLGTWMASLELSLAGKISWLPTHASGVDQVERIFSQVQREVLPPHDFPSPLALEKQLQHSCVDRTRHPQPMQWTYTKTQLMAKFGTSQPTELAA